MPARLAALMDERKKLERELTEAKKKLAMGGGGNGKAADDGAVRDVGGVKLWPARCPASSPRTCRASPTRARSSSAPASSRSSASSEEGRAGIVVGVTDDLTVALQRGRSGQARAPRRWAARAAAAGPTWRRPAGRTARKAGAPRLPSRQDELVGSACSSAATPLTAAAAPSAPSGGFSRSAARSARPVRHRSRHADACARVVIVTSRTATCSVESSRRQRPATRSKPALSSAAAWPPRTILISSRPSSMRSRCSGVSR